MPPPLPPYPPATATGTTTRYRDARTYTGIIDIIHIDDPANGTVTHEIYITSEDDDGTMLRMVFPGQNPTDLKAGMRLRVTGDVPPDGLDDTRTIYIVVYQILSALPADRDDDSVLNMRTVAFLITKACNATAATTLTVDKFKARWFDGSADASASVSSAITMERYYRNCSYGKVLLTPEFNAVLGPFTLPCTGTGRLGAFNTASKCDSAELYGWADLVEQQAQQVAGVDLSAYRNRILIMPLMPACQWAGLGSVGCGAKCYTWINNGGSMPLDVFFHELGHNLGLQHSNTPGREYGDVSCAMGSGSGVRCFNAPQTWSLGWSKALAVLNASNLATGRAFQLALPPLSDAPEHAARIVPTWLPGAPVTPVFVSFRTATLNDGQLPARYAMHVSVHVYNGTTIPAPVFSSPELVATLAAGDNYTDATKSLRIRVLNVTAAMATVTVCRYSAAVPDCGSAAVAPRPPPPPSSPSASPLPSPSPRPPPPPPPPSPSHPVSCGDNVCDASGNETAANCPADCPKRCGDGYCDALRGETPFNCGQDCAPSVCGDGECQVTESKTSCPTDCCPATRCGDGICQAYAGETCHNCPADCNGVAGRFCCGSFYGCGHRRCNGRRRNFTCVTGC